MLYGTLKTGGQIIKSLYVYTVYPLSLVHTNTKKLDPNSEVITTLIVPKMTFKNFGTKELDKTFIKDIY